MKQPLILSIATLLAITAVDSRAAYSDTILADNPVAYYQLNEPVGSTTASDLAAPQGLNDGAQDGGVVTFGLPGLINEPGSTSTLFGGAEAGRLRVPGFDKLGTGYSVEYWINIDALPGGCCSALVGDGVGAEFFLMNYLIGPAQGQVGDIRPHYGFANSPVATDSNASLLPGQTYHVVTTYDATNPNNNNAAIFINGVEDKRISVTGNLANESQLLFLGRDDREGYNGAQFRLDEVAVYDFALTATDVSEHYLAGLVPEPSSFALFGSAAGAMSLLRRRRSGME